MQQTCRLHNFELRLVFQCDPETEEFLENLWSNLFETNAFEMGKNESNRTVTFINIGKMLHTISIKTYSTVGISVWITESIVRCVVEGREWGGTSNLQKEYGIKFIEESNDAAQKQTP
jgi:hypothetical protein